MSKLNDFLKENSSIIKLVGFVATVIGLFVMVDGYIDSKIERKITDTEYISKLAKQLRPFLIFDENGTVIYDHGADGKIKNITVDLSQKNIEIETTEFLQLAPFISAVGYETYSFKSERTGNKKWKYTMLYREPMETESGSKEEPKTVYVLEVLY